MSLMRPFRFGCSIHTARPVAEVRSVAERLERQGFDLLYLPDHLGAVAPFSTLAVAAAATETLHVGTLVVNNDFWNPVLLAREAASLAVASGGRFELGMGAGHAESEYEAAGITYDRPAVRVDRLAEAASLVRRLLDGETVTHQGRFHRLDAASIGFDVGGRVPLLIGGNGNQVLTLGAELADTVGLVGFTSGTGQVHTDLSHFTWAGLEDRIERVRRSAGGRFGEIELNVLVQSVTVGDRSTVADELATVIDQPVEVLLDSPFVMLGSEDEMAEHCDHLRQVGVTSVAAFEGRGAEALVPVIARLR